VRRQLSEEGRSSSGAELEQRLEQHRAQDRKGGEGRRRGEGEWRVAAGASIDLEEADDDILLQLDAAPARPRARGRRWWGEESCVSLPADLG
jgi:hypothetical protein